MTREPVKKRVYRSPGRDRAAAETRARILAAAEEHFLSLGYGRTSTARIATTAAVSEAALFATFGSKSAVLLAVIGARVANGAGGPLREQAEWRWMTEGATEEEVVHRFVRLAREAHERSWRLIRLARAAAESDDAVAAVVAEGGRRRRLDCNWLVTTVLGHPSSPAARHAVDILWAETSVDLYQLFVVESGWSTAAYERHVSAVALAAVRLA